MLKYFSPVKLDKDIIMSCDMLRLCFSLDETKQRRLFSYINMYDLRNSNITIKMFRSYSTFQYANLINIINENDKNSFAMGIAFNGANSKQNTSCFIEFNPNKTMSFVQPFLDFIKQLSSNIDIVRFDIAFDIPYPRELFNLIKDRRNYKKIYSMEQKNKYLDDFTEYLGKRQNNGYVKLYNKQIESNLDKPLTRLEITLDKLDYNNLIKEMPTLKAFSKSCTDLSRLNETEKVLLSLLLQNDNCMSYFGSLGRYMREKLEPYICTSFNIDITESDFYHFINLINNIIN